MWSLGVFWFEGESEKKRARKGKEIGSVEEREVKREKRKKTHPFLSRHRRLTEHAHDGIGAANRPRPRQRPAQPLVPLVHERAGERRELRVERGDDGGERDRVAGERVDLLQARRRAARGGEGDC